MTGLRKAINANTSVLQSLRQLMEQPVLPTNERQDTPLAAAPDDPHDLLWADSPAGAAKPHPTTVFCGTLTPT